MILTCDVIKKKSQSLDIRANGTAIKIIITDTREN